MAESVYLLCALTSVACAILLVRGYMRTKSALSFWGSACFVGLSLNNVLLYVDLVVAPDIDLSLWRASAAMVGMAMLMFGLVWESK